MYWGIGVSKIPGKGVRYKFERPLNNSQKISPSKDIARTQISAIDQTKDPQDKGSRRNILLVGERDHINAVGLRSNSFFGGGGGGGYLISISVINNR